MPWPGTSFKEYNHSLSTGEAKSAGRQATAMLNSGVPEGIAIATANKHINKLRKRGVVSDKAHDKHLSKYGPDEIDASQAAKANPKLVAFRKQVQREYRQLRAKHVREKFVPLLQALTRIADGEGLPQLIAKTTLAKTGFHFKGPKMQDEIDASSR